MVLLSIQSQGAIYTVILFVLCAVFVHAFRLAKIGYKSMKKRPSDKKEPKSSAHAEKPEPVYYIVERKKKRPKAEYSDPKRISFK